MCFSNDSFWVGMNSAAQGYFHKEVKHVINNIELEVQVTTIVMTIVKADCKLLLPHIRKVQGEQPTCNSDWTKYSWCYIFLHNVLFYPVTPNQIIKKKEINGWIFYFVVQTLSWGSWTGCNVASGIGCKIYAQCMDPSGVSLGNKRTIKITFSLVFFSSWIPCR